MESVWKGKGIRKGKEKTTEDMKKRDSYDFSSSFSYRCLFLSFSFYFIIPFLHLQTKYLDRQNPLLANGRKIFGLSRGVRKGKGKRRSSSAFLFLAVERSSQEQEIKTALELLLTLPFSLNTSPTYLTVRSCFQIF